MRVSEWTDRILQSFHIDTLSDLALHPADRTIRIVSQQSADPIRHRGLNLGAYGQEIVLLLPNERPHEKHEDDGSLAGGRLVGPSRMPKAAFEDQSRAGWTFCGEGPVDVERIVGRNVANVASWEDPRAAILPRNVGQEPHDVESVVDAP